MSSYDQASKHCSYSANLEHWISVMVVFVTTFNIQHLLCLAMGAYQEHAFAEAQLASYLCLFV